MKKLIILILSLMLTGCLVPEKFNARISFAADGSYTFTYTGITAYTIARAKTGNEERDAAIYRADAEKMLKRPEFKKVDYLNNGRYDIEIEYHKKPGESLKMFDVFSVSTDKDNVVTITSKVINSADRKKLAEMGVEINGKLSVSVPYDAEILSHNASSTPYLLGLFGSYSWQIDSFDQQPILKFRLAKSE